MPPIILSSLDSTIILILRSMQSQNLQHDLTAQRFLQLNSKSITSLQLDRDNTRPIWIKGKLYWLHVSFLDTSFSELSKADNVLAKRALSFQVFSVSRDGTIRLWDFSDGVCARQLDTHRPIVSMVRILPLPVDTCSETIVLRCISANSWSLRSA